LLAHLNFEIRQQKTYASKILLAVRQKIPTPEARSLREAVSQPKCAVVRC